MLALFTTSSSQRVRLQSLILLLTCANQFLEKIIGPFILRQLIDQLRLRWRRPSELRLIVRCRNAVSEIVRKAHAVQQLVQSLGQVEHKSLAQTNVRNVLSVQHARIQHERLFSGCGSKNSIGVRVDARSGSDRKLKITCKYLSMNSTAS